MTEPLTLDQYPRRTHDKVRYADTDRQGHVNNAVFATFLETGRVEFLYAPEGALHDDDGEFVIAKLALDFRAETQWPGTVEIGTGVARVGNSSITLRQGLFQGDTCVATAETVIVQIHRETRKGRALSEATKARLAALVLPTD